jgi:hypothetical protein
LECVDRMESSRSFALYQGTTLVVPQRRKIELGFSVCVRTQK